jgi:SAM-dependent methyltransferase
MGISVKDILDRLAHTAHRGGAFNSEVLIAIAEVLPEGPLVTIETGCGKSTIMFSNLSAKHFVFAYDDSDEPDSSVGMVRSDPEFISANTVFVFGPTQLTLPNYQFPAGTHFDVILIDGPHGYPFPDLEYAMLYNRLRPGGILIIDDVHIASIGKMYDILREDRMYDDIGVFSTTGLLRRTTLKGVPADGDHWYEQNYNVRRFPLSMEKYYPDRMVKFGEPIDFTEASTIAKYVVKGIEHSKDGSGAQTIDQAAALEFAIPLGDTPMVRLQIKYSSNYVDASDAATLIIGHQSWPLPYTKSRNTLVIDVNRPASGRIRVMLMHPNAEADHYRGMNRYDFRRPGALIHSILLVGMPEGLDSGTVPFEGMKASRSRIARRLKAFFKR